MSVMYPHHLPPRGGKGLRARVTARVGLPRDISAEIMRGHIFTAGMHLVGVHLIGVHSMGVPLIGTVIIC